MEQTDAEEHRKKAKEYYIIYLSCLICTCFLGKICLRCFQFYPRICCQLAVHASRKKDYSSAVQFYREALTFDENDTQVCDLIKYLCKNKLITI